MDLDDADLTTGAHLLAYGCGCAVKILDGWAVDVTHCDEPTHAFIGASSQ